MPRARGITSELLIAFQSSFTTAAASGDYLKVPFFSYSVGAEDSFDEDVELGTGRRDAAPDPGRGRVDVAGDAAVALRAEAIGHWLKLLLGAPTTSGSAPDYTHTFVSGKQSLPFMTAEAKYQSGQYLQHVGLMADTLNLSADSEGAPRATLGLTGRTENKLTSSQAGTPTQSRGARFQNFQGTVKKDGSAFANLTAADLQYQNGLDKLPTVGDGGLPDAIDPGLASATGTLTARVADFTLYDIARNGSTFELEFGWSIDASTAIAFTLHKVRLQRAKRPIEGPGGIEESFSYRAEDDEAGAGQMMTVTLNNQVADYA